MQGTSQPGAGRPLSAGTPGMCGTAPGRVPQSRPCQVQPTQGKSPLLLPPHLLGINPTQCPLRSGLRPPARGQPSTHGRYGHPRRWHKPYTQIIALCSALLLCAFLPRVLMPQISFSEAAPTPQGLAPGVFWPGGSETLLLSCEAELVLHALAEAETSRRRSGD